jgi:chemotaxis protein methyltransferase CheR
MNAADFEFLAGLLQRRSGLYLNQEKKSFLESRLRLVAARHGFKNIAQLVRELRTANESLAAAVTDATTTHDTGFFRDGATFQSFRETMLPALFAARLSQRRLRIWCAAASTGQEAYSLAMILDNASQFSGWSIEILATDIHADVIGRAKEGLYNQFEMLRGLPIQMLAKYFRPEGQEWRINDGLRDRIAFRVFNLLDSYDAFGVFDVIFCRNVLIYFDSTTKKDVLVRLSDAVAPDGYLALGTAETTVGLTNALVETGTRGVYTKAKVFSFLRAATG